MKRMIFLTLTFFAVFTASAQSNDEAKQNTTEEENTYFISHKVAMGEQLIMISKKYMVDPKDIYQYNKWAVDGLTTGATLQIPLHKSHKKDIPAFIKSLEKEHSAKKHGAGFGRKDLVNSLQKGIQL